VPIELHPGSERDRRLWHELLDLADAVDGWTIIGARMVELHAAERRQALPRLSIDADALADARANSGTRRVARALKRAGFELDEPSAFGLGHVFRKGGVEIDVLAPDGLNARARRLTIPPAHTVEVPGGTQALRRTEMVEVRVGRRTGHLPRPSLLGAILVKARAVRVDDVPNNQRADLALLLSFVDDVDVLTRQLAGRERTWLKHRAEMNTPNEPWWQALEPEARQRGLSALRSLAAF
jgi:hypothetical protein